MMRIKLHTPLSFFEIAAVLNSPYPKENRTAKYISTDTRELRQGDVFFALDGENYDGEDFTDSAHSIGAFTVSKNSTTADFLVMDTEAALLSLAKYYKAKTLTKLRLTAAITGSVGKTTTKEILAALIKGKYRVHATKENFNNSIGLSHTLLSAPKDTEILLCELGMNHPGEIKRLADVASPDVAIITNVGNAHIENLGSRENIAKAKLELLLNKKKPLLIAPYEEKLLNSHAKLLFSIFTPTDCLVKIKKADTSGTIIDIFTQSRILKDIKTGLFGEHNILALASCIPVLELLYFSDYEIISSVSRLENSLLRPSIKKVGGITVFDDTYSSSPEAVIAMLKHVSMLGYPEFSCVLGDMLELGDSTRSAHKLIGICAAELGYRKLYAFGKYSRYICEGAKSVKNSSISVYGNENLDVPEITAKQINETFTDGILLVKASHGIHAERIYEYLRISV